MIIILSGLISSPGGFIFIWLSVSSLGFDGIPYFLDICACSPISTHLDAYLTFIPRSHPVPVLRYDCIVCVP